MLKRENKKLLFPIFLIAFIFLLSSCKQHVIWFPPIDTDKPSTPIEKNYFTITYQMGPNTPEGTLSVSLPYTESIEENTFPLGLELTTDDNTWTFLGWSTNPYQLEKFDFTSPITDNHVLYAFWMDTDPSAEDMEIIQAQLPNGTSIDISSYGGGYVFNGSSDVLASDFEIPEYINGIPVVEIGHKAFAGTDISGEIVIPDTIKVINYGAFEDCENITSIIIGSGVEEIWEAAFADCTNLTKIQWGDKGPEKIGARSFQNTGLTNVEIPEGVKTIGLKAFMDCTELKSVIISSSVETIETGAFNHDTSLRSVTIKQNENSVVIKSPSSSSDGNQFGVFEGCTSLSEVNGAENISKIGSYAFKDCTSLTELITGDKLDEIGMEAFSGCENLASIDISNVRILSGSSIFYNCHNIESLVFERSDLEVGNTVFRGLENDTVITFSAFEKPAIVPYDNKRYDDNFNLVDLADFDHYDAPENWDEMWDLTGNNIDGYERIKCIINWAE